MQYPSQPPSNHRDQGGRECRTGANCGRGHKLWEYADMDSKLFKL
jgi:hypothetical protein